MTSPADHAAFFDDDYRRILEPFHPEEEARFETGAIRELLGLEQSARILDLGCGWGRHLQLLREAGHDVVGLDLSLSLLRHIEHGDGDVGAAAGGLVGGDMRFLPFRDASFDVVLNLATSIGLFLESEPALMALREAHRVLRPGGSFLLEGMHRADVEANYLRRDRWQLEDGTVVRARRRWDAEAGISHERLDWHGPAGQGTRRHSLRVRSTEELEGLVRTAGFAVLASYGDWTGDDFHAGAPRLVLLSARAGRSVLDGSSTDA